ncbi:MAG TPA: isocitrate lyase/phosphoenolpyruvate mutase family protein [Rhodanobacteraceae bacterium]|nr:isocitrate lyase/phosphoenolpyruvate mutase family protein [Rhodanobacteraceae bacterium]
MASQADKAESLRALHHGATPLLLPNAWDAGSAALFARRNFTAIATTSGGMGWSLGYADGEQAPLDEILAGIRRIARVIGDLPLTVDFESGYGSTPAAVAEHVRAVIDAGAVGINLEDSLPGHGPLRSLSESAARIAAAREAASACGVPIVINARMDCWMQAGDERGRFDAACARGRAYLAAGADCLFPIGLTDTATLGRLVRELKAPISVAAGPAMPDRDALAALGIARISTATRFATLALDALDRAAAEWLAHGLGDSLAATFSYADAQALFASE